MCTKCKDGFYQWINDDGVPDIEGCLNLTTEINSDCLVSTRDGSACTKCSHGLIPSPDGQECIESIANCVKYSNQPTQLAVNESSYFCSKCIDGFYWDGQICAQCTDNCKSCNALKHKGTVDCTECNQGFIRSPLLGTCVEQFRGCAVPEEGLDIDEEGNY